MLPKLLMPRVNTGSFQKRTNKNLKSSKIYIIQRKHSTKTRPFSLTHCWITIFRHIWNLSWYFPSNFLPYHAGTTRNYIQFCLTSFNNIQIFFAPSWFITFWIGMFNISIMTFPIQSPALPSRYYLSRNYFQFCLLPQTRLSEDWTDSKQSFICTHRLEDRSTHGNKWQ